MNENYEMLNALRKAAELGSEIDSKEGLMVSGTIHLLLACLSLPPVAMDIYIREQDKLAQKMLAATSMMVETGSVIGES